MTFDYRNWVKETRELVKKYSTLTTSLENQFHAVEVHATMEEFNEAEELKKDIEMQIQPVFDAMTKNVPSFPVPANSEGEIVLGRFIQGDRLLGEFKVPIKHFNRHAAIFAQPGHGKTVLLVNIIHQLIENKINILAFDFKQDLRHLKHLPIVCLRWNWLRINPFSPPPGVDELEWITQVCSLIPHVYGTFFASKNYFLEFAKKQYEVNQGSGYVSLWKVHDDIKNTKEKEYERGRERTVVLNRFETLLTVFKDVLDCNDGFPIHELLNYPVVIEMDGCQSEEANLLISLFVLYILEYRKAQRQRGSFKHDIIFDEAHRIFYRQSENSQIIAEMGPSIMDRMPRELRDYDEGCTFSTQEPSQISNSVMANTDIKIVGYLGNGLDIEAIQKAYQLSDEEKKIIKKLKIGQFMVQKSGLNEGEPFLIQGYDYPIEKTVTDDELKDRMKNFITIMQSESGHDNSSQVSVEIPKISDTTSKILKHAAEFPLISKAERYKELGIHPNDGKLAIAQLVEAGLVEEKSIRQSKGRPSVYLNLTDSGKSWLKENEIELSSFWKDYVGHVGFEHSFYQWKIAECLEKLGYIIYKEHDIGRKRLDVYAEKDGSKIGIEVCVSPKMNFVEANNITENLDEIKFVCANNTVIQQMQNELDSLKISNPKFKFVIGFNYLNELDSSLSENGQSTRKSTGDAI